MGSTSQGADWDFVGGLAGSRHQDLVLKELTNQMSAPDISITTNYLFILAKLRFLREHEPLPREEELNAVQDSLYQKAAALVSSKNGAARAATVQTLLERPTQRPAAAPLTALPEDEIAVTFLNLPPDQQLNMLSSFWERLQIPAMLEPLKKVVQQPDMTQQQLRDMALRRLYDLNPSEATPVFWRKCAIRILMAGTQLLEGKH